MPKLTYWFNSLPIFTRHWFSISVVITLLANLGILNPCDLILDFCPFSNCFHIWRPLTALFYYPMTHRNGFKFLKNFYLLFKYSQKLETEEFKGKPADYFSMLIFNWLCCVIVGHLWGYQYLMDAMVMSVLNVWCQLNKDTTVNYLFGTRFKAKYLPWVLMGLFYWDWLLKGHIEIITGILVGHLYVYLTVQYPRESGNPPIICTPQILYYLFPENQILAHGGDFSVERPKPERLKRSILGLLNIMEMSDTLYQI